MWVIAPKKVVGETEFTFVSYYTYVFSVFMVSLLTELCPGRMDKRGINIFRKVKEISGFIGIWENNIIYMYFIRFWLMNCNTHIGDCK